jgi:hypothetical protein
MSKVTRKALTQELLMVGCAAGTIKNVCCSISDRHRRFGHNAPLAAESDLKRLYRAMAAVKGTLSKLLFPIGIHHLRPLLDLIGLTECQSRDVLVCATGMALCCRVVEVTDFQFFGNSTRNMTHLMRALWRCTFTGGSKTQHVKGCILGLASHLGPSGTSLSG